MKQTRQTGFTLLEVVVVVIIIGIMVAVGLSHLNMNPAARAKAEAKRLALLIQDVRQEAILEGTVYAIQFQNDQYRFLRLDRAGNLVPVKHDDILRPRQLPAGLQLEVPRTSANDSTHSGDATHQGIVITPSGDIPPFQVVIEQNGYRWEVRSMPPNKVVAKALHGT